MCPSRQRGRMAGARERCAASLTRVKAEVRGVRYFVQRTRHSDDSEAHVVNVGAFGVRNGTGVTRRSCSRRRLDELDRLRGRGRGSTRSAAPAGRVPSTSTARPTCSATSCRAKAATARSRSGSSSATRHMPSAFAGRRCRGADRRLLEADEHEVHFAAARRASSALRPSRRDRRRAGAAPTSWWWGSAHARGNRARCRTRPSVRDRCTSTRRTRVADASPSTSSIAVPSGSLMSTMRTAPPVGICVRQRIAPHRAAECARVRDREVEVGNGQTDALEARLRTARSAAAPAARVPATRGGRRAPPSKPFVPTRIHASQRARSSPNATPDCVSDGVVRTPSTRPQPST